MIQVAKMQQEYEGKTLEIGINKTYLVVKLLWLMMKKMLANLPPHIQMLPGFARVREV